MKLFSFGVLLTLLSGASVAEMISPEAVKNVRKLASQVLISRAQHQQRVIEEADSIQEHARSIVDSINYLLLDTTDTIMAKNAQVHQIDQMPNSAKFAVSSQAEEKSEKFKKIKELKRLTLSLSSQEQKKLAANNSGMATGGSDYAIEAGIKEHFSELMEKLNKDLTQMENSGKLDVPRLKYWKKQFVVSEPKPLKTRQPTFLVKSGHRRESIPLLSE